MGIIVWLIVGGVVGWLASIIMRTDAQQGLLLNIVVGIVGALLAGFIISPMLGIGTINEGVSLATFLVSLGGAIVLLAIVNLFRTGVGEVSGVDFPVIDRCSCGSSGEEALRWWQGLSRSESTVNPVQPFFRYFSNHATIALAFAADCDGRAVNPPCDAPGTLTSAVGTPLSCSAW